MPNENISNQPLPVLQKILQQLFYFLLLWQTTFKISNAAISSVLRFLRFFLSSIGNAIQNHHIHSLSQYIPLSRDGLRKATKTDIQFTKFIVCPDCDCIYTAEYCQRNGKFVATTCTNKPFPKHPMVSRRKECGAQLMKTTHTK